MSTSRFHPGQLVSFRGRDWMVLPSMDPDILVVKPLGGSSEETTGMYFPVERPEDYPEETSFPKPSVADIGDIYTARFLYNAARLGFRDGAGPFRSLAKISFRPRAYQIVPLVMALQQQGPVRLLIADDVGVGKTVEALLVLQEMMERAQVRRFAVVCLPHLCNQWQQECRAKLGIDAVIIRSSTQARLDRLIQGDTSVYEYYPYQIISIDYIKSDRRRSIFIEQCPELVIVDEVHTCAKPAGASKTQQQRYHLIHTLVQKKNQYLILLTATPHSGKPAEFQSLLGLLNPEFEGIDLPDSTPKERRTLSRHFVQRKRADVVQWMGEDTPFPERDAIERQYTLSNNYADFFDGIVTFARKLVAPKQPGEKKKRAHYWTALGLLRGVMSSPAAGVKMLQTRSSRLDTLNIDDTLSEGDRFNPIADHDFNIDSDVTPVHVMEHVEWTTWQGRQLNTFSRHLASIAGTDDDRKLHEAARVLGNWISDGFNPVVFCRYIATAGYVGEHLRPILRDRFPDLNLQVVTSEHPDDLRKERIEDMAGDGPRVLVATDCLSEGINLQDLFTAVLHYDLPWNPNRLEQREGRVDRFGQSAPEVKTCLLYGEDNPVDGIVLDVLLRKVRDIKRDIGISIPFPEDSQSIIDTITQALLLNPKRPIQKRQTAHQLSLFDDLDSEDELHSIKENVTRKLEEAARREKVSRSIFAQNAIKAHEIEQDLRAMDEAIGNPAAVRDFVTGALEVIFGVQVMTRDNDFAIVTDNLPGLLKELLPKGHTVNVSFESPTPEGYHYLGRNHPFVEQLCQMVMANTVDRQGRRASRAAVIRTRQVQEKTTLLLFRCRNVIEQKNRSHQIVAEEMFLWGWRGIIDNGNYLDHPEAHALLYNVRASSNLSKQAKASFLEYELETVRSLNGTLDTLAENRSERLVEAHERFNALMNKRQYQVVRPVLPMDLMGMYILLPEDPT